MFFICWLDSLAACFLKYFSSGKLTENFFRYSSSRITTDMTTQMSIALNSKDSIFFTSLHLDIMCI